jgi:hypothetical protein
MNGVRLMRMLQVNFPLFPDAVQKIEQQVGWKYRRQAVVPAMSGIKIILLKT